MTQLQSDLYDRIFEYPVRDVTDLVLTDPSQIASSRTRPEVAAWALLLGAIHLGRAGQRSPANDWLNHAMRLAIDHGVFRAELLGEAGQGLYKSDRLEDAFTALSQALAAWRDVCQQAVNASKGPKQEAATEFAAHLLALFAAAGTKTPPSEAAVRSGAQAIPMVQRWLAERAILARAQTASTLIRLLAKFGDIEAARTTLTEEIDWIARNFTSPGKPVTARPLDRRQMSNTARRALYLLLLAEGKVALAAREFQQSADGFEAAATLYENKVEDYNDINRLLQAKFNQANSLLRLNRIEEALAIYELCEHGFASIGDTAAVQRVAHAKLFARSRAEDDDDS